MRLKYCYLPEDSKGLYEPEYLEPLIEGIKKEMRYNNYNYTTKKIKLIVELLNRIYFHYPHKLRKLIPSLGFEGAVILTLRMARQFNFGIFLIDLFHLKTAVLLKHFKKDITFESIMSATAGVADLHYHDYLGLEELTEHALEFLLSIYDDMFNEASVSIKTLWEILLCSEPIPTLQEMIQDEKQICDDIAHRYFEETQIGVAGLIVFEDFSNHVREVMFLAVK